MKTNLNLALILIGAVAFACFTVVTSANADISVQAFFSPGVPSDSTNNLTSQQNKMAWLDTGNLVGGAYETNPVAMTLPKVLKMGDVLRFRSAAFPGWLAVSTSSGPDKWGARLFCMLKITNSVANINPRRVLIRTWTSLTDNVLVSSNWVGLDSAGPIAMSSTTTGRYYGADGVKGGSDDVVFNSGTSDVELNELIGVGPRIFINIMNQADLDLTMNYWEGRKPIELHCEVVVFAADMTTVLGRTEIILPARPFLWCDRGPDSLIQYVSMESERPPKAYQLEQSTRFQTWQDVPGLGGLLQNGGIYTNNATLAETNFLFFRSRESVMQATGSVNSVVSIETPLPFGGSENGNEVP